ncbi:AAA family ATPase, partial [Metasolibacillus meyeri]|uniref:AAA family ATPase n=1 Tax=Metasolibacillus meyeri TaxID=1071052 RepID=UPI00128FCE85
KNLKIDNVRYNQLFSTNEEFKKNELKKINDFLKENRNIFEKVDYFFRGILSNNFIDSYIEKRFENLYNRLRIFLHKSQNGLPVSEIEKFNRWLSDYDQLMRILEGNFINSPELYHRENVMNSIKELTYLVSHLQKQYRIFMLINDNNELILSIKKILERLSVKSALYIATDNIDIIKLNQIVEEEINNIDIALKGIFWEERFGEIQSENYTKLLERRRLLLNKVEQFNEVMKKYTDIKIKIENCKEIIFFKKSEKMSFDKLSSGERRLSYLFLNIIFNDVDIYLIDEPELSLSLNFQNKIITDLHILTKNKVLFIATHAPYIYEDFIAIEGNISKEV